MADSKVNPIVTIANQKALKLESSKYFVLRFMSIDKLEYFVKRGHFVGEICKFSKRDFVPFKGYTPEDWMDTMFGVTKWEWSRETPVNYKKLEDVYILLLKKVKDKRIALIKFQKYLVGYLSTLLRPEKESRKFNPFRTRNLLEELDKAHDEEVNMQFFEGGAYDYFKGILEDEEYLVKNEKNLKDILLRFASVPFKFCNGNKGFEARWTVPYHVVVFTLICDYPSGNTEGWGYFDVDMSSLLACQVCVENRDLLQKVRKLVIDKAQDNPNFAIAVYDWKGNKYWP